MKRRMIVLCAVLVAMTVLSTTAFAIDEAEVNAATPSLILMRKDWLKEKLTLKQMSLMRFLPPPGSTKYSITVRPIFRTPFLI